VLDEAVSALQGVARGVQDRLGVPENPLVVVAVVKDPDVVMHDERPLAGAPGNTSSCQGSIREGYSNRSSQLRREWGQQKPGEHSWLFMDQFVKELPVETKTS
jgi:hypothetical protein